MKLMLLIFAVVAISASDAVVIRQRAKIGGLRYPQKVKAAMAPEPLDPMLTCETARVGTVHCSDNTDCAKGAFYFTCIGYGLASDDKPCPETKPYCVSTSSTSYCSTEPSPDCAAAEYQCLGIGTYPEIGSCKSYYKCELNSDGSDVVARRVNCPSGLTFNPAIRGCTVGVCVTPACPLLRTTSWKPLNYALYDTNRMGLLCVSKNNALSVPEMVYECPNNMRIDLTITNYPECLFQCTLTTKRAADLTDIKKYYECVGNVPILKTCADGKIFDDDILECVNNNDVVGG